MTVTLDYTNMLADVVSGGVVPDDWQRARADYAAARKRSNDLRGSGQLGFLDLPGNKALHDSCVHFARDRAGRFDDVVILGIGGSGLGPIAIRTALLEPNWNALTPGERGGRPRLHVLDNVDPRTIRALLGRLRLDRSLFVVTSKSGGTAETMAQYLVIRERLQQTVGDSARDHLVFVTDPEKGALRTLARSEGITALEIPPAVGGRYSVLSPVGLLPAALVGVDTAAMLAGAADMAARAETDDMLASPPAVFGTLQYLADTTRGRPIHVLMPYSDALRDMSHWFVQLWAESLGKHRTAGDDGIGPTPLASVGATDQHSQVQLFMEGAPDKTVTFIAVKDLGPDVSIPALHADVKELAYLGGHSLAELLSIEQRATAGALARRGRPNMTITVDRADAWHVGALFMLLEIATIHAGMLYGINPLDQPGVELGKQFAYGLLGRADADEARREWELLPKSRPDRVL